jgi:4-diphosphocytidyl-2-C-methyl-D-erythritol kinase
VSERCAAAPAKLNLYLHVTGRRRDGYHLLDSLVAFAGIHDVLVARPSDRLELEIAGPFSGPLAAEGDNIVLSAARALAAAAGIPAAAHLSLVKRLPLGAGIGGGSADAAAALELLGRLWGVRLDPETLDALALSLGADVPVCRHGRTAFMSGVGERLDPAPALPPAHLVLANPRRPLPTARVFGARRGPYTEPARFTEAPADAAGLARLLARRRNDLYEAARRLMPELDDGLVALARAPGCLLARMSGSGATCFGLFDGAQAADAAAAAIKPGLPGWWVVSTPLTGDARELAPAG